MPDEVGLLVDGREFAGWKTARVTVSMEAGSGSFELEVSAKAPAMPAQREVRPGSRCSVRIGSATLITGWVDELEISLEPSRHSVRVRGRDAAADLIDCAPNLEPSLTGGALAGQWSNVTLLEFVRDLAKPFGIPVSSSVAPSAREAFAQRFAQIALSPGQKIFEVIEQQCRYRQVLPLSDGKGGLLLSRASRARVPTPLIEGQNILSQSITYNQTDCFSHYYVKGQGLDLGNAGASAGQANGAARDKTVTRFRPLLIVAEKAVTLEECNGRAAWESLTRAARAARLSIDVAGWRQPGGALWPVNALVAVRSPTLGATGDFLITQVTYSLPSSVTSLSLVRPDAFLSAPPTTPEATGLAALAAAAEEAGQGSEQP